MRRYKLYRKYYGHNYHYQRKHSWNHQPRSDGYQRSPSIQSGNSYRTLVIIIIILIILFILSYQIYIPYKTVQFSWPGVSCKAGTLSIEGGFAGMNTVAAEATASLLCMDYFSSRCRMQCSGEKPICQCQALARDIIIPNRN